MIGRVAFLAMLTLAACMPQLPPEATRAVIAPAPEALPRMLRFDGTQPRVVPLPDNGQLARDFLELSFGLESGRRLERFTRFEGPVTVNVAPGAPSTLRDDLEQLLVRMRREAGVDIRAVPSGAQANISIEALPRAEFQRYVPHAACFVVPNVSSWAGYLNVRRRNVTDWTALHVRTRAAVFLPSDVSPQEVRDCLHEEIAQALGPLNDLYRLPWSVFNDDNLHAVLTGYDMLILRATYDPVLHSGMSEAEVAAVLPGLLRRLNPGGEVTAAPVAATTRAWGRAIDRALSVRGGARARERAAQDAVRLARAQGLSDVRMGYSLLSLGRASLRRTPEQAISAFVEASGVFRAAYGDEVHTAHAAIQPAAFAVAAGQPDLALRITEAALPAARRAQNAALVATLLLLRSEALAAVGQGGEARALRREAQGWGRYGFGSDDDVRTRVAEVAALRPGL